MKFKPLYYIVLIINLVFFPTFCLADDYIESNNEVLNIAIEAASNSSTIPSINARHAVILDRTSNIVLYGKNENETCKMASTTKIMTAIVVIENCNNLNQTVTISKKSARNRWLKTRFIHR